MTVLFNGTSTSRQPAAVVVPHLPNRSEAPRHKQTADEQLTSLQPGPLRLILAQAPPVLQGSAGTPVTPATRVVMMSIGSIC